jgi:hypothetical protein
MMVAKPMLQTFSSKDRLCPHVTKQRGRHARCSDAHAL